MVRRLAHNQLTVGSNPAGPNAVTTTMKVFVAGPYTGGDSWGKNLNRVIHAADRIMEAGHTPFVPHTMTALWDLVFPKDVEEWYDLDKEWVKECDAFVAIGQQTNGVIEERMVAVGCDIPTFHGVENFLDYAERVEND